MSEGRVGFTKQDEYGLNAGRDGLFEAARVGNVKVDVVVDVYAVWCWCWVACVVEYAWIQGVIDGRSEAGYMATPQRLAPSDFVEDCTMF